MAMETRLSMWSLLIAIYSTFSGVKGVTSIDGFASKEKCEAASLQVQGQSYHSSLAKVVCIEVRK